MFDHKRKRHCWLRGRRHALVFSHQTIAHVWRRCTECGWETGEFIHDRPMTPRKRERVRIVEMNGCMATVRGQVREGVVVGFVNKQVYGDYSARKYVVIRLDDGSVTDRVARPGLWSMFEGVREYQE